MIIDAHHHLWTFNEEEFPWVQPDMPELRKDFHISALAALARSAGVAGTVVVQARQSMDETAYLLSQAKTSSLILGVVGWLPLADAGLPRLLEDLAPCEKFKGLRHVVQAEQPGFLQRKDFQGGMDLLCATGLTYDVLVRHDQLTEVTEFSDRNPQQSLILDHLGKPPIRASELEPWRSHIVALAKRPNVTCKISGMVTEANVKNWSEDHLRPYFDTVLDAFGPSRLMAGSDWPVLNAGSSYAQWWQMLKRWLAALSPSEQSQILGETAARVYKLQVPS